MIERGSSSLGGRSEYRKEPAVMTSVALPAGPIHLGLDTSKDAILVGILRPDEVSPDAEKIFNDEGSIRRLIDRFPDRSQLRVCYEAGPTGFGLHRLLTSMGVACEVIAPALIPKAPADRVKTDRRDCQRLARLHRAGELVAIRVPTQAEEAVRDLCRARADLVQDRTRTRHRLVSSCCATTGSGARMPGRASTRSGLPGNASTSPHCTPPTGTTGGCWPPATANW